MSSSDSPRTEGGTTPFKGTSTTAFGSSKRESHDASGFYQRFTPPVVSDDATVEQSSVIDELFNQDARELGDVLEPNSVALVVTSPPYFAGKEYEETLGENGVPGSYLEYLELLREVFARCVDVLEPGGRLAVNVANLGRRPYRSLSADVTNILGELGLLLRGEVVWWKGRAAGGSCAWGTFQRPNNPVLRDVTERVVIASKGRFDRALTQNQRHKHDLPSTATISRDEFLDATTDLWEIPSASANRVGHPAPFPVELPRRLIELYTYANDVVLDPFMGAGTTAVAAIATDRHFVGFETDQSYIDRANERINEARQERERTRAAPDSFEVTLPARAVKGPEQVTADSLGQAITEGRQSKFVAEELLANAGFGQIRRGVKMSRLGIELSFTAVDATGREWAFDLVGGFTTTASGLNTAEALWRAIGKAGVLHEDQLHHDMPHQDRGSRKLPLVILTTDLPTAKSAGSKALAAVTGPDKPVYDVIQILDPTDQDRLANYAAGPSTD